MRHGIPNLGALQAFEATARLGSFSRAAEELSLTHSAVFRQVSGLEERLGVQLFTRIRRRIALTEQVAHAGAGFFHLRQDEFGVLQQLQAYGREAHALRAALQQAGLQIQLQFTQGLGQRRLRQGQGIGGAANAAVFGHGNQSLQLMLFHRAVLKMRWR